MQSAIRSSASRSDLRGHTAHAVAHDINNLLHVILGCCDHLRTGTNLSPEQVEELEHIAVAVEHATALTAQLLVPGRKAEPRSIDLRRALVGLRGLLRRIAGDAVLFQMHLPREHALVPIAEGDLAQILVNLVVNAREAMPTGGKLTITASGPVTEPVRREAPVQNPGRFMKLEIVDSGTGMSAAVRERAFERFFSTKASQGTGHGLATVQAIVHQHGGTVQVQSEPGQGTHFTILIPVCDSTPVREVPTVAPRANAGETVLVVDDEAGAREVVTAFLQGLGYATHEAASGGEALAGLVAPTGRVDLVVADVTMPDMTGIELARLLSDAAPSTPVLLVSGDTEESVLADGGAAIEFLQKPFTSRDLGTKVRALLDEARDQRAISPIPARLPIASAGAVIDELPAPVFVLQHDRFVYVNASLALLMAIPQQELLGHEALERVHPDDRSVFPRVTSRATDSDTGQPATTQVRVRCGDGAERSLVLTTVPSVHNGASALLGVATDVTLQPDALNVAVRMAALGRLAGGVAHDYNNLLLVIGGHLERLQQKLFAGELKDDVDAIARAANRAGTLTDKLLSFGRRQMLAPEVLDLGAIVDSTVEDLRTSLGKGIELRVERAVDVPPIEADTSRLREVLWHLVDNAREAMPSGGTLTLAIDAIEVDRTLQARWAFLTQGGTFVRLRVIDTGRGMEPAVAAHAFEPFFTTKGKGRGAGMGLASVYGIVKQSGGYVFAERTGEHGTCMTVLLPPVTARDIVIGSPAVPSPVAIESSRTRNRILLVEDDAGVRELLEDVLQSHGFEVRAVESAEDAQVCAGERSFDLLLTDVDLPGMNGARLAAVLTASQPRLRVILMSGYPDDGTIDGELDERPMFLRKPFRSQVLIEQVRVALADQ